MKWLVELGTWLSDQWSWVTAIIVGPVTWFLGRVGVLATKRTDAWLEKKADQWDNWRKAGAVRKDREQKERDRETHLRKLETERVGARFRVKETKDDPGRVIEVIGLDPRHPDQKVRTRPVDEPEEFRVTLIEWRQLTKSPDRQIHETARFDARSDDDADGWIRYERVDEL